MLLTRRELFGTSLAALLAFTIPSSSMAATARKLKNGVDISWLPDVEAAGGKFYTATGHQVDGISLLLQASLSHVTPPYSCTNAD